MATPPPAGAAALITTATEITSPLLPVATMVWLPGGMSGGIVTVTEKSPLG